MQRIGMMFLAVMLIVTPAFCGGYIWGRLFDNGVDYSNDGWLFISLCLIVAVVGGAFIIGNFHRSP